MKRLETLALLASLFLALGLGAAQEGSEKFGGDAIERGRQLYRFGRSARGLAFEARIAGSEPLPAAALPCAQCHGLDGSGGVEGGALIPSLLPARLRAPYGTRDAKNGRFRPAYDERALGRALIDGLDPAGDVLDLAMPRYGIDARDLADLHAYLGVLGAEPAPGCGADEVRIGALLPLAGDAAPRGRALATLLENQLRRWNERGGIHGRRVALCVADCGPDAASALAAAHRLLGEDGVLAFVACADAGAGDAVLDFLAEERVPVIGPQRGAREAEVPGTVFYLLPSLADQGRAAARFLAEELASGKSFACWHEDSAGARELAQALLEEARRLGLAPETCTRTGTAAAELLVCLGTAAWVEARLEEARDAPPRVLLCASLLAGPACAPGRALELLAPALGPGWSEGEQRFEAALVALPREARDAPELGALRLAHGALELLEYGLAAAGRALDRERLVAALCAVRRLETGVLPPLSFGRVLRVGTRSSLVLSYSERGELVTVRRLEPAPVFGRVELAEGVR